MSPICLPLLGFCSSCLPTFYTGIFSIVPLDPFSVHVSPIIWFGFHVSTNVLYTTLLLYQFIAVFVPYWNTDFSCISKLVIFVFFMALVFVVHVRMCQSYQCFVYFHLTFRGHVFVLQFCSIKTVTYSITFLVLATSTPKLL